MGKPSGIPNISEIPVVHFYEQSLNNFLLVSFVCRIGASHHSPWTMRLRCLTSQLGRSMKLNSFRALRVSLLQANDMDLNVGTSSSCLTWSK